MTEIDRRQFLKGSAAFAALAVPKPGFQLLRLGDEADAGSDPFRIAYLSDAHLFAERLSHRNTRALRRAIDELNALDPQPDFVVFGGDLAQGGRRDELELGRRILSDLRAPLRMVVGERDWYLDMGRVWRELFGPDAYAFEHRGVHFVTLNSIHQQDFWTGPGIGPEQRMAIAGGLDDVRQNPFTVGREQREWLRDHLEGVDTSVPVVVLSHAPLYKLYRPWNFWTDDAEQVHELLSRFDRVTVIHGHTHQPLAHRIGNISFFGMLSTTMPWPQAPEGLPELTIGLGPSSEFVLDGGGSGQLEFAPGGRVAKTWVPWVGESSGDPIQRESV